jgi:hypothetical protein
MSTDLNFKSQNKQIQDALVSSIEKSFPITTKDLQLDIHNIQFNDTLDDYDFPQQKEIKLNRKSWQIPVIADFTITDVKSGKVISSGKNIRIGHIPKITNRFTTIIDGNEYQTISQIRRRSGVYSRLKQNGELEAEFNLMQGRNFKMQLDPISQLFVVIYENRKYRLWTLLNTLGIPDTEIAKVWGHELLEINKKGALNTEASELSSIYTILYNKEAKNYDEVINGINNYFRNNTKLDAETTKVTLGESFEAVTPEALLAASSKLLKINKGEASADDRDSLIFKRIYATDDLLKAYFDKQVPTIAKKLGRSLEIKRDVKSIFSPAIFGEPIKRFFTVGDLSSTPPQTNPVTIVAELGKTTPMGTGGIASTHSITSETRNLQPTHFGFLDPLATPECVTPDTYVFTEAGWKLAIDITSKDLIACNIDGVLEFHKAEKILHHDYDGQLVHYKNNKIDLSVTTNHRVWARTLDLQSHTATNYKIIYANATLFSNLVMTMTHTGHTYDHAVTTDFEAAMAGIPAQITKAGVLKVSKAGETCVLAKKGHIKIMPYTGKVIGLTVPGGLIYVKKLNSYPVWTGNSLKVGINVGLALRLKK